MKQSLLGALGLLLIPTFARCADAPGSLKLTTERLVVFKDGYGLVVRKGTATADAQGRVFTTDVPDAAILGCFWATADDSHKILTMRAEWDEHKSTRKTTTACLNVAELMRANVGKTVTLDLTDKTEHGASLTQEGKIAELLDIAPDSPFAVGGAEGGPGTTAGAYWTMISREGVTTHGAFPPEAVASGGTLIRELTPRGGDFVVLEHEGKRTILPVNHVQSVVGKDLETKIDRQEEIYSKTKRLSMDFGKESAGKPVALHLLYFTSGLRWIPTYRVSGDLKDKAAMELQGEILNDVTDVEHADVDLVVGVPNFRFKENPSPLTLEKTLRTLMIADSRVNVSNNSMVQSQFSNGDFRGGERGGAAGGEDMAMAPELAGAAGEQDLFVYSVKDFSLKKSARATVPLWQTTTSLRHVYTYDIKACRNGVGGGIVRESPATPASPLHIQMNQVWHQLELTNASKIPWTTGAALILRELLPIGQDLITYTPPGSKALLPVTIAVDLRGSFEEQESERTPSALRIDRTEYTLVKKKGAVTVTSYRKDKSDVRVTLAGGGKVTSASDDGKIKLNDFRPEDWEDNTLMHVNNHSDVTWEFSIGPGETKTIAYEVQFYLR
jgi:hypothetical protein